MFRRGTTLGSAMDAGGRSARSSGSTTVTSSTALRQSVVWGASRLRSDLVSLMPVDVFRKASGLSVEVAPPPVLVEPSSFGDGQPMSIGEWLGATQMDIDQVGNTIGVIAATDAFGLPAQVDLVPWDKVRIRIKDYKVHTYWIDGEKFEPREIWHERGYRLGGLPVGLSPLTYAALNIAGADAAQRFALEWFVNGSVPAAILRNAEKSLDPGEAERTRRRFKASMATGDVFVTGKDWTYEAVAAKAAESSFIEQMEYSDVALCRFYGVPADLVDVAVQSSTVNYANISQRNLQVLTMNLGGALNRRDTALSRMTPRPRFVRLNRSAILAMDPVTRAELFKTQIESRQRTPDEARGKDDVLPLTEADYAQFERLWPTNRPSQQQSSGGN
nr:phage portal protein [Cellulomonas uda]